MTGEAMAGEAMTGKAAMGSNAPPGQRLPVAVARFALSTGVALSIGLTGCGRREVPPAQVATDSAAPPARIAFAITAPRQGDTLVEGQGYVIRWMAPDTMHINLGAAMGGKDKGMLLVGVSASPDSLLWQVPVGFVTGFGPTSSDQVRLRLENAANPAQWTEAGPFTVRGAP